jgi:MinD-like ATPase involved in chromosome partitioning or flagellar assembly
MSADISGKIVTFYSYKGGVGRSMAVANIGVLLAQMDKKVLLVDWDLEAPGLEEYFQGIECLPKQKPGGLLQLLRDAPEFKCESFAPHVIRYYIHGKHEISLLDSGHDAHGYRDLLARWSWPDYFEKHKGGAYLERLRNHWLENYDFVLIDSRTGITDAGGVCTIQMPDVLVLMFAANQQSLTGVLKVAKAVVFARPNLFNTRLALPILPVPSRFEGRVEQTISGRWMERFAQDLGSYYEDWIAAGVPVSRLIEQIKIPYIPRLSFGEELSVVTEGTSDPDKIGFYYRNLANLLTSEVAAFSDSSELSDIMLPTRATPEPSLAPRFIPSIFISSSYTDLHEHRASLIRVVEAQGLKAVAIEYLSDYEADIVDSSLELLRRSDAYVGVIGHLYGPIPKDVHRNPHELSITELEFNEARRLGLPTLIFVMGDDHPVRVRDIETDPAKLTKLRAFRNRLSQVVVYGKFDSLVQFRENVGLSISLLRQELDAELGKPEESGPADVRHERIPEPPALYAEPPYIGSHGFVGRQAELDLLSDWAQPAESHAVLLLESIGGGGKSMLAWEWVSRYAHRTRTDWAGRFWYSFYERGAVMADFCRHALAYMTSRSLDSLRKQKTPELTLNLLESLRSQPWLIVLDGLERVLAAYNRADATEDDATRDRDPGSTIRPEDGDLLRALAAAGPSRVLITSRLMPRALLSASGQPIPGVHRIPLSGLRPTDAEALLRSCGVTGSSQAMQDYVSTQFDGNPLVIGVVAGLINDYLTDRGHFDAWVASPDSVRQIDLGSLNLTQRRHHILGAAFDALPDTSKDLLSMLAMLSDSIDYSTLTALSSPMVAARDLATIVRDLERRGLVQYDSQGQRYGLHPVVRGIVAGRLDQQERERYGQQVIDHFARTSHKAYEEAETLDDLRSGIHVVRTLIQMERYQEAAQTYVHDLRIALFFNLENPSSALALLRPLFPLDWSSLPIGVDERLGAMLSFDAAIALDFVGDTEASHAVFSTALQADMKAHNWRSVASELTWFSAHLVGENRLADAGRVLSLLIGLVSANNDDCSLFAALLERYSYCGRIGEWEQAQLNWNMLDSMGRDWPRWSYRPGDAEYRFAQCQFWSGDLEEHHLVVAEHLASENRNHSALRHLHWLRGMWRLEQGNWHAARESLAEAVRMSRERGSPDYEAEAGLTLARFHLGELAASVPEAEQLALVREPAHRIVGALWLAIGDVVQARTHALAAYRWACADGEPYVDRYDLKQTVRLLDQLGVSVPAFPAYDSTKEQWFPWEVAVRSAIDTQ